MPKRRRHRHYPVLRSNPVDLGAQYNVTIQTQPSNPTQSCNVTNGSGFGHFQCHERQYQLHIQILHRWNG